MKVNNAVIFAFKSKLPPAKRLEKGIRAHMEGMPAPLKKAKIAAAKTVYKHAAKQFLAHMQGRPGIDGRPMTATDVRMMAVMLAFAKTFPK